jgi:hypothetical protein
MELLRLGDENPARLLQGEEHTGEPSTPGGPMEHRVEDPRSSSSARSVAIRRASASSSAVIPAMARSMARPSMARLMATISSISSQSGLRTVPMRWLSRVIKPSLARSRIASRTGVVLTSSWLAISVWTRRDPPGRSPRRMADLRASRTRSTAVIRRERDTSRRSRSSTSCTIPNIEHVIQGDDHKQP